MHRGFSIHYLPADVQDIDRHEASMLIEQVLAIDRQLTLLPAMAEHIGFKLSPILQQVSVSTWSPIPPPPPATPPVLTVISSDEAVLFNSELSVITQQFVLVLGPNQTPAGRCGPG